MLGLAFFILLDGVLTLWGQPAGYWTNTSSPNERNVIAHALLVYSPTAFALGIVFYASILSYACLTIPRIFSLVLSITMIVGHSGTSFDWLPYRFGVSDWTHLIYGPAVALLIIYACAKQYGIDITKENR